MKYDVIMTPTAADDLKKIYEYIAFTLCEKVTAENIISLLRKNILSLDEMPGRCRIYDLEPWKSRNLRVMSVKNYLIFYIPCEENKTVNIIRIIYGSRNIEEQLLNKFH